MVIELAVGYFALHYHSYWHGCERCYDPGDKLVDGKTCRELNESTQDRLAKLREPDQYNECVEVEEIWVIAC